MTLLVVPAWMLATVTTVGSKTSTLRVTMVWIACTISHAMGTGSSVRYGSEAWPPAPLTRMRSVSDEAMIGPCRVLTQPLGRADVMWMARRRRDRAGRAVGERRDVEQALVQHVAGAVVALLAGLEHEQDAAGEVGRRAASSRAEPASMATWVSWPQACIAPSTSLAKSSPVCSGIGRASMSPRSRIVGPGLPPVSRAAMPLVDSCSVTSRSRPSSSSRMRSLVIGRSLPTSPAASCSCSSPARRATTAPATCWTKACSTSPPARRRHAQPGHGGGGHPHHVRPAERLGQHRARADHGLVGHAAHPRWKGAAATPSEPYRTLDPVPIACEIVQAIQTMVTRKVDVFDPTVVTVTQHPRRHDEPT